MKEGISAMADLRDQARPSFTQFWQKTKDVVGGRKTTRFVEDRHCGGVSLGAGKCWELLLYLASLSE